MNISPFLSVHQTCDETLTWAKRQLTRANLQAVQTFDLHTARSASHDCPCPNHGTDMCDCQMVVLLVYGKTREPETLILHGNDGLTWVSIVEKPGETKNTAVVTSIKNALENKLPAAT